MSLSKEITLTITNYSIKMSSPLYFYVNDSLKLVFTIKKMGIINANNFNTISADYFPLDGLTAKLLIENFQGIDSIEATSFDFDLGSDVYEIFSGYDTSTASKYLESTMVESGIGIPIVHDKYSYCHGRSTLGINYNGIAIYYNRNTEFDRMMLEELKKYYSRIITIASKFKDQILDDYQMLIQSMYLTKYIAEKKSKDLSKVEYSPIVKKLYKYNGQI